jgi:hypothetical protein
MVRGSFVDGRLAYYVALVNGNGINVPANSGAGLTLVSRVEVMPLGAVPYDTTQTLSGHAPVRFSLAAGSYVDLVPDGDAVVGGDATFVAGPFILLAEAYLGWQEGRSPAAPRCVRPGGRDHRPQPPAARLARVGAGPQRGRLATTTSAPSRVWWRCTRWATTPS